MDNNNNNGTKIKYLTTNDVLIKIGYKNPWILFNLCILAFVWGILSIPFMITSFTISVCHGETDCKTKYPKTYGIIDEFNLDKNIGGLYLSVFYIGGIFSCMVLQFGDTYGRKKVTFSALLITGCLLILSAFIHNFVLLLIIRFVTGITWAVSIIVTWVLISEIVHFEIHPYLSAINGCVWIVGYCIAGYIAYLLPNWHNMVLVTAIPCILQSFLVLFFTPESLFYLVEQKKTKQVGEWLSKAEKCGNTINCDVDFLIENVQILKQNSKNLSTGIKGTLAFLKNSKMYIFYLFGLSFIWIATLLVYVSLSFGSSFLGTDPYLSFVLSGIVEIPANTLTAFIIKYIGRKKTIISALFFTSIFMTTVTFIKDHKTTLYLVIWLFGKSTIAVVFITLYVYSAEIFPTVIRGTCMGTITSLANIGGIISAHTELLKNQNFSIGIYVGFCLIGTIFMIFFPEATPEDKNDNST